MLDYHHNVESGLIIFLFLFHSKVFQGGTRVIAQHTALDLATKILYIASFFTGTFHLSIVMCCLYSYIVLCVFFQQKELCNMILDCCAQQRTYEKFFGLLAGVTHTHTHSYHHTRENINASCLYRFSFI